MAKLKPEQQIAAVRERLKLVNPGFDGKLQRIPCKGERSAKRPLPRAEPLQMSRSRPDSARTGEMSVT